MSLIINKVIQIFSYYVKRNDIFTPKFGYLFWCQNNIFWYGNIISSYSIEVILIIFIVK